VVVRKKGRPKTSPLVAHPDKQQSTNDPIANVSKVVNKSAVFKLCNQIEAAISTLARLSFSSQLFVEMGTERKNSSFQTDLPESRSVTFSWREIVCYGVGSLELGAKSRIQFAIAELIRRNSMISEAWCVC